jgi:hypothetical protein
VKHGGFRQELTGLWASQGYESTGDLGNGLLFLGLPTENTLLDRLWGIRQEGYWGL